MSRSNYSDDYSVDQWSFICWRGAVESAIRGKRGQAFLREMLAALDALPEPKLIAHDLVQYDGASDEHNKCCAIGAVGLKRGVDMARLDPEDYDTVAARFGVSAAMVREIVFMNDEWSLWKEESQTERFYRMRRWIKASIIGPIVFEDDLGRWADDGGR